MERYKVIDESIDECGQVAWPMTPGIRSDVEDGNEYIEGLPSSPFFTVKHSGNGNGWYAGDHLVYFTLESGQVSVIN